MAYTIDDLNALVQAASGDELPIWDVSETGPNDEPTKKIMLQNLAAAIKTLASLLGTGDVVDNLTSTATNKPLSANMGRALNEKRQLTITAGAHTAIDQNDSYICGNVMVINFKCHTTSAISSTEAIATIEEKTVFNSVVPLFIGGEWTVTGATYGYVTGKNVLSSNINIGQYVHVNFTTLLA